MRCLNHLVGIALMCALILIPVNGFAQNDPVAKSLGLTPDAGSLPVWSKVDSNARQELGNVARAQDAAVFLVGNPKVGLGTAWVISKKHRLLATNAHVADIRFNADGKMIAIRNGSNQLYAVEKIWYHPGVRRNFKGYSEASIASTNPADGPIDPLSPDLAVLQLSSDGPELPVEFPMATPEDLHTLFGQGVAIIGYPGHDTANWPALGERANATYHEGVISRITDFHLGSAAPIQELQFVQYTMATWAGFSGSPVFLANGRVAATHNMARSIKSREGEVRSIPHGIRVDSLWELLVYHKLTDKVALKIDPAQVLIDRWLKTDEKSEKIRQDYARAVALVSEGRHLIFVLERYAQGVDKCSEAIKLMPNYARAYYARALGFNNYWFDYRRRLSPGDARRLLYYAKEDATKYAQLVPSDPTAMLLASMVLNNIGSSSKDRSFNREALDLANKLLQSENLTNILRAEALSARGVSYNNLGENKIALQDHNAAISLAPDYPVLYETRADYWRSLGRRNLEQADYAKARELRNKQKSP